MKIFGEQESKYLENILAWGSIAYASGFITVLAHTARLGIPVIELIKPIYIWIGFPLALVIFSSRWIWQLLKRNVNKIKSELDEVKNELVELIKNRDTIKIYDDPDVDNKIEKLLELFTITTRIIPFGFSSPLLMKLFRNSIKGYLDRLDEESKFLGLFIRNFWNIKMNKSIIKGYSAIVKFVNFVLIMSLIPVGCYLYIFLLYPKIPQSLGGGLPTPVKLFIDSEKIPLSSEEIKTIFPATPCIRNKDGILESDEIELLYTTENDYFIRNENQPIISLSKESVNGVIWISR